MSRIGRRDTKPEVALRKALHARGKRYALDKRGLPGRPDIFMARHRAAVFVHGCFWHGHGCGACRVPTANQDYWRRKFARNRERDAAARSALIARGYRVATIWECAVRLDPETAAEELLRWLEGGRNALEIEKREGAVHAREDDPTLDA